MRENVPAGTSSAEILFAALLETGPTRRETQMVETIHEAESEREMSEMIQKAQHAPGPWTLELSRAASDGFHTIRAADGSHVVCPDDGWNNDYRDTDTREANARLIASAPDLLDVVKRFATQYSDRESISAKSDIGKLLELADWAIDKAEGK